LLRPLQEVVVRQVTETGNDVSPVQLASIAALRTLRSLQLSQRSIEDEHMQVGGGWQQICWVPRRPLCPPLICWGAASALLRRHSMLGMVVFSRV
jgi:hypothetical protein